MIRRVPWEHVLDDKATVDIAGKTVKVKYDHVSCAMTFEYDDEPVKRKEYGQEECYGCGKTFKWSVTPGAIPTCDQCMRWISE